MTEIMHSLKANLNLPQDITEKLESTARRTGQACEHIVELAIRKYLHQSDTENAVYLSAPINALVEGLFVEDTTIAIVKEHGDFGLGTFNYLDGEMVLIDGIAYQIQSDGNASMVPNNEQTPFACATFFKPDTLENIQSTVDESDFFPFLDRLIPSTNMLYAIRIDGVFGHVKVRAVPKSENYRPLVEATKNQPVFDYYDVEGCLAGFYTPHFMESLHAPGYHLHFLTSDRKHGGHLMNCSTKNVTIGIQHVPKLEVGLPFTLDYLTADLTRNVGKDLEKAER